MTTATFTTYESDLKRLAHKFSNLYGGEYDDTYQSACVLFLEQGSCENPLRNVWFRLLDKRRTELRRSNLLPLVKLEDYEPFVEDDNVLSPDSQTVLDLIHKDEVQARVKANDKYTRPQTWRKVLWEYLSEIGWAGARITESFTEIAEWLQ